MNDTVSGWCCSFWAQFKKNTHKKRKVLQPPKCSLERSDLLPHFMYCSCIVVSVGIRSFRIMDRVTVTDLSTVISANSGSFRNFWELIRGGLTAVKVKGPNNIKRNTFHFLFFKKVSLDFTIVSQLFVILHKKIKHQIYMFEA